ncbi:hypothetical protein B7494_g5506 [Chlorociboria aeruginascens]|nr:hypothetical protein B7494_g5506 [Chlorociboria aeruginascens]
MTITLQDVMDSIPNKLLKRTLSQLSRTSTETKSDRTQALLEPTPSTAAKILQLSRSASTLSRLTILKPPPKTLSTSTSGRAELDVVAKEFCDGYLENVRAQSGDEDFSILLLRLYVSRTFVTIKWLLGDRTLTQSSRSSHISVRAPWPVPSNYRLKAPRLHCPSTSSKGRSSTYPPELPTINATISPASNSQESRAKVLDEDKTTELIDWLQKET